MLFSTEVPGPALDITSSSTTMKLSLLPQGSPGNGKGRLVGQRAHCMSCPKRRSLVVASTTKFAQVRRCLLRSRQVNSSLSFEEGCRVGNKRTLTMAGHTSSDPNTEGLKTCLPRNTHPDKYAQFGQQGVPTPHATVSATAGKHAEEPTSTQIQQCSTHSCQKLLATGN